MFQHIAITNGSLLYTWFKYELSNLLPNKDFCICVSNLHLRKLALLYFSEIFESILFVKTYMCFIRKNKNLEHQPNQRGQNGSLDSKPGQEFFLSSLSPSSLPFFLPYSFFSFNFIINTLVRRILHKIIYL